MLIIHQGQFGLAVAQAVLQRSRDARSLTMDEALSLRWEDKPKWSFVAMALGSLHPNRVRHLARLLWDLGISHSLVVLSDQNLLAGPLVLPPAGPCLNCALARNLSMFDTPQNARLENNRQLYMEKANICEIEGYLPSQVQMAAVKLLQHASLAKDQQARLDVISLNGSWSVHTRVTALHGCACRGTTQTGAADRWADELGKDIEDALRP